MQRYCGHLYDLFCKHGVPNMERILLQKYSEIGNMKIKEFRHLIEALNSPKSFTNYLVLTQIYFIIDHETS